MDIFNRKKVKAQEDKISELEQKIINQKTSIYNYKDKLELANRNNRQIAISLNSQLEQNKKLIEWIYKIINECGTMKVNQDHMQIPIMERQDFYTNEFCGELRPIECETITIPTITIQKKHIGE